MDFLSSLCVQRAKFSHAPLPVASAAAAAALSSVSRKAAEEKGAKGQGTRGHTCVPTNSAQKCADDGWAGAGIGPSVLSVAARVRGESARLKDMERVSAMVFCKLELASPSRASCITALRWPCYPCWLSALACLTGRSQWANGLRRRRDGGDAQGCFSSSIHQRIMTDPHGAEVFLGAHSCVRCSCSVRGPPLHFVHPRH